MTVIKVVISLTVPEKPWACMKSPTLKGLSSKIITPPAKLERLPCRAMPMASPAAPRRAIKEVVLKPAVLAAAIKTAALKPSL